jgi:hypothetical protein
MSVQVKPAALAAPASSSCRTQWLLALRLSLSPQQRGLPPRARPRWIIWLLVVAAAVDHLLEVVAQVDFAQERDYP